MPPELVSQSHDFNVPGSPAVGMPDSTVKAGKKIEQSNNKKAYSLEEARLAAIKAYSDDEQARLKRQGTVLIALICTMTVQMGVTDYIIGCSINQIIQTGNEKLIELIIDVLKVHIASTIVELIAMFYFIVKTTFTDSPNNMMKMLIRPDRTQENNFKDEIKK